MSISDNNFEGTFTIHVSVEVTFDVVANLIAVATLKVINLNWKILHDGVLGVKVFNLFAFFSECVCAGEVGVNDELGGWAGDEDAVAGEVGIVGFARPFKLDTIGLFNGGEINDESAIVNFSGGIIFAGSGIGANKRTGGWNGLWIRGIASDGIVELVKDHFLLFGGSVGEVGGEIVDADFLAERVAIEKTLKKHD